MNNLQFHLFRIVLVSTLFLIFAPIHSALSLTATLCQSRMECSVNPSLTGRDSVCAEKRDNKGKLVGYVFLCGTSSNRGSIDCSICPKPANLAGRPNCGTLNGCGSAILGNYPPTNAGKSACEAEAVAKKNFCKNMPVSQFTCWCIDAHGRPGNQPCVGDAISWPCDPKIYCKNSDASTDTCQSQVTVGGLNARAVVDGMTAQSSSAAPEGY